MGSPDFAVPSLKRLLEMEGIEVVAVFSQPDRPAGRKMQLQPTAVKAFALSLGLPVFTPEKVNTDEFRALTQELRPDIGVVVAFGQILGMKFLNLFSKGCVNVHASLLPRWRGAAPIQRALMAGDEETGVCLQTVVKQLDAGDIIAEKKIKIERSWDALILHKELSKLGGEMIAQSLWPFVCGEIKPISQSVEGVTYAHKIEKSEGLIDFKLSAVEIENKIRGLSLGPQPYGRLFAPSHPTLNQKTIKIFGVAEDSLPVHDPEQVGMIQVNQELNVMTILCGQGKLRVSAVQPESKQKMQVSEFLRGYGRLEGARFE